MEREVQIVEEIKKEERSETLNFEDLMISLREELTEAMDSREYENTIPFFKPKLCILNEEEEKLLFEKRDELRENTDDTKSQERADEIEEILLFYNIRLLEFEVRKFLPTYTSRDAFLDYRSEGFISLRRAIKGFDIRKNNKFSTYAVHAIRNGLKLYHANQGGIIWIPIRHNTALYRSHKIKEEITVLTGEEPSNKDVFKKLGYSARQVKRIEMAEKVKKVSSLDSLLDNNKDQNNLHNLLSDTRALSPEENAARALNNKILLEAIATLSPKEQETIKMRNGLGEYDYPHVLKEVGKKLKISGERARQLEKRAIKKLRLFLKDRGWTKEDI